MGLSDDHYEWLEHSNEWVEHPNESPEMFWDRVVHKKVPKGLELNIEQGDAYVWVGVPKRNIAFFQLESTKRAMRMRDIPEPTPESTRLEAKCINWALRITAFINKFKLRGRRES